MRGKRFALFILMIGLGLIVGLIYGWIINPIKYENTSPEMLRADYKADYALMVAEIYHSDQNLGQAAQRLALLSSQPPIRIMADALVTAKSLGYAASDLERMTELSQALQVTATPSPGGRP
jgi:hypothetical protein